MPDERRPLAASLDYGSTPPAPARRRAWLPALLAAAALVAAACGLRRSARPAVALSSSSSHPRPPLSFVARSVGYAALPQHTLNMYARWTHIVEPHRATVLEATIDGARPQPHVTVEWRVALVTNGSAERPVFHGFGANVSVAFDVPSATYRVSVFARDATTVAHYDTQRVMCKYVRREIRTLTAADLSTYFGALERVYNASGGSTDAEAARAQYGARFRSHDYFVALHNSQQYCYHKNLAFLTSHPAFTLELERALQAIEPSIAHPYWDFTMDHSLGARWSDAPVYDEDMFGTVDNDASDNFRVRGRFRDVATVLLNTGANESTKLVNRMRETELQEHFMRWASPLTSPYGFVNNPGNVARSRYLQRSNRFCGMRNEQPFPSCGHIQRCFDNFSSLLQWDLCIENNVHANLHGLHGGLDRCPFDLPTAAQERLSFLLAPRDGANGTNSSEPELSRSGRALLSFLTANIAEEVLSKYQQVFPYVTCPSQCNLANDTFDTCKCTAIPALSGNNLTKLTDPEVHRFVSSALIKLYEGYEGDRFMYLEMRKLEPTFRGLNHSQIASLERVYLDMLAAPGTYGTFATGAAPNDPLFFPMHPIFEKAWQLLRLSPAYAHLNMSWDNVAPSNCEGGTGWHDKLPFADLFDNVTGVGEMGAYTNSQLWELFEPAGDHIPYVYDNFEFGDCSPLS